MKNVLLDLSQQITHSNRQICLLCIFSYVMMWGVSLHLDDLCVNVTMKQKGINMTSQSL